METLPVFQHGSQSLCSPWLTCSQALVFESTLEHNQYMQEQGWFPSATAISASSPAHDGSQDGSTRAKLISFPCWCQQRSLIYPLNQVLPDSNCLCLTSLGLPCLGLTFIETLSGCLSCRANHFHLKQFGMSSCVTFLCIRVPRGKCEKDWSCIMVPELSVSSGGLFEQQWEETKGRDPISKGSNARFLGRLSPARSWNVGGV